MARNFDNFNLSDDAFVEKTFEPIPEGRYDVEVDDVEEANSNAGNLGYKMKLKSVDGSFDGILNFDMWITPKTIGTAVRNTIKSANLTPVPAPGKLEIPDAEDFIGAQFNVEVKHEEYQAKDKETGDLKVDENGEPVMRKAAKGFPFSVKPVGGGVKKTAGGGFDL